MSVYSQDGVDFSKEHDVVDVFKALYRATKEFTADLVRYGFSQPDDIGYFSDGIRINTAKLAEAMGGGDIALVYGMDGAGTKPRAHEAYRNVMKKVKSEEGKREVEDAADFPRICTGIDTVAMVVNDLICGGARPMHLLDYVAWQELDVEVAREMAAGLYQGAKVSGATVVGGENASLSEMINGYDICACGSGLILITKYLDSPLTGDAIRPGDAIIGIGGSGVHCNGISTARKKLLNVPEFGWNGRYRPDENVPEFGKTAAEEILTPTIIYKEPVLDGVLSDTQFDVKAIVNITGEGINNLKRALMKPVGAEIDLSREEKLRPQPVFDVIQREGKITDREMWDVYNNGIGMMMVVPMDQADAVVNRLEEYKVWHFPIQASRIGKIIEDPERRVYLKTDKFEDIF